MPLDPTDKRLRKVLNELAHLQVTYENEPAETARSVLLGEHFKLATGKLKAACNEAGISEQEMLAIYMPILEAARKEANRKREADEAVGGDKWLERWRKDIRDAIRDAIEKVSNGVEKSP